MASKNGQSVLASLVWTIVPGAKEGQVKTMEIIQAFRDRKMADDVQNGITPPAKV